MRFVPYANPHIDLLRSRKMQDDAKTKGQLIIELKALRKRLAAIDVAGERQVGTSQRTFPASNGSNEELRESEELLRIFIERSPAAFAMFDREMRYLSASRRWLSDFNLGESDLRGVSHYEVFPEITERWKTVHRRGLAGEVVRADNDRFERADGSVQWLRWEVRPWRNQAGDIAGIVIFSEDITQLKNAEAERARLKAQNWQLQKAESLGRMAGAIAHLFNNHLTVVIGNLEMALMDLSGDAVIREDVIEAMRAARQSAEISELLLSYLGQSTAKHEPLDLSDVCRLNLPMFRDAVPEGVALETDLLSPGPVAHANANQMRQVLTHLVTNGWESIRHTAGTVTLTTRIIPAFDIPKPHLAPIDWKPTADLFACLEVTDTGCGIAEEDLGKIFDPFFTTKLTGRGLGLAVVLGIVKTWGGAIDVESQQNKGSTFRVFLPLITGELPRPSENATEVHQVEQGGTVLLVEDQDMVRKMAKTMLHRMGYEVVAASGGTEAVKLFRKNPDQVRLVITDLTMPGMNGWETMAALRKIRPHIPVVLVSGHDEAHAMGRDYPEQPHVFLHKPYFKSDLEAAIDTALKKSVSNG
jgi:two-component system, cell cycle sensor histidine kinase and response regulator CckA